MVGVWVVSISLRTVTIVKKHDSGFKRKTDDHDDLNLSGCSCCCFYDKSNVPVVKSNFRPPDLTMVCSSAG